MINNVVGYQGFKSYG